ncbi:hypothetical protein JMJ77_0014918, partial [Colletotrichum scovillei]
MSNLCTSARPVNFCLGSSRRTLDPTWRNKSLSKFKEKRLFIPTLYRFSVLRHVITLHLRVARPGAGLVGEINKN